MMTPTNTMNNHNHLRLAVLLLGLLAGIGHASGYPRGSDGVLSDKPVELSYDEDKGIIVAASKPFTGRTEGKFKFPSNKKGLTSYKGCVVDGVFNDSGYAQLINENGDEYNGGFNDGKRQGTGCMKYGKNEEDTNCRMYFGDWNADMRHGQGDLWNARTCRYCKKPCPHYVEMACPNCGAHDGYWCEDGKPIKGVWRNNRFVKSLTDGERRRMLAATPFDDLNPAEQVLKRFHAKQRQQPHIARLEKLLDEMNM